ncbi:MAG: SDR family oxidoreductase [Anaerolineales bacterium]
MSFHGRRALVTGGSSGIGLALAHQLAAQGAAVTILARNISKLERAADEISQSRQNGAAECQWLSVDVTDAQSVQEALRVWLEANGAPHYLFNSAGVAHPGYAEELDIEIFHWMMDVNYYGLVHVTQTLLPAMIEIEEGHIVNISSMAGVLGVYGYTAYGASKFAVRGYSDALRAEIKPKGLKVSVVYPPDVQTPQLEYENQFKPPETKALAADANPMSADQAAEVILKGVARGRYLIIPGLGNWLYYWLSGALGPLLYPVMDIFIRQARAAAEKKG